MKLNRHSRRMFLQGMGGVCLAIPFLHSLMPKRAHAAAGRACRFIAIKSYSPQLIREWYPTMSGNGYTTRPLGSPGSNKQDGTTVLTQQLPVASGRHSNNSQYFGHEAPLTDFAANGISGVLGPQFNPHHAKMLLLRGLDFLPDTNHNDGGMLGNYAGADNNNGLQHVPTIDQVLAYSDTFNPTPPAGTRSLHMRAGYNANTCSFTDGGIPGGQVQQVQAHQNPLTAYNEAFGNVTFDPMEPQEHPNLALLDRVYDDYAALRNHSRLSTFDRDVLERHMQFISELQGKLEAAGQIVCSEPTAPGNVDANVFDPAQFAMAIDAFVDVTVAAMVCDVTRVATIDIWQAMGRGTGSGGSDLVYSHNGTANPQDWHEYAHQFGSANADANILAINQWIADAVFLKLIERLDVPEGVDGDTYLDNSIVMWGNELGMNHLNWSIPTVLAGGAGGKLKTGRFVDYIDWNQPGKFCQEYGTVIEGVPYNQLLVTILQAAGLQPGEYEANGNAGYGAGTTAGKNSSSHAIDYDFSQLGNPLPDLLI